MNALTVKDFEEAIKKAGELDHMDQEWPVYEFYKRQLTAEGTPYFRAPSWVMGSAKAPAAGGGTEEVSFFGRPLGDRRVGSGVRDASQVKGYVFRLFRELHDRKLQTDLYDQLSGAADLAEAAKLVQLDEDGKPLLDEDGVPLPGPSTRNSVFNSRKDLVKDFERWWSIQKDVQPRHQVPFRPLRKASLFLHFAELANEEITEEDVAVWVHVNGVLGLDILAHPPNAIGEMRGGPRETVEAFRREAEEANWVKLLYEAALRTDSKDEDVANQASRDIANLFGWPEGQSYRPQECKDRAIRAVEDKIQEVLGNHCTVRWRRAGNGLVEFPEFRTLLGAMYFQFAWVLRERAHTRRCKFCRKPIGIDPKPKELEDEPRTRKTYKNKEFCGRSCKNDYANERRRERSVQPAASVSVAASTGEEIKALAAKRGLRVDEFLEEMTRVYKDHRRQH